MIWPVELTHSNECEKECPYEQSEKRESMIWSVELKWPSKSYDLVMGTYSFEQNEKEFPYEQSEKRKILISYNFLSINKKNQFIVNLQWADFLF